VSRLRLDGVSLGATKRQERPLRREEMLPFAYSCAFGHEEANKAARSEESGNRRGVLWCSALRYDDGQKSIVTGNQFAGVGVVSEPVLRAISQPDNR
jgi:hypothetical protein